MEDLAKAIVENLGNFSQFFVLLIAVAGFAGAYFSYKNGQRKGATGFASEAIKNLKDLAESLSANVDELEDKIQKMTEQIIQKDAQIRTLQDLMAEKELQYDNFITQLRLEFELERRHLLTIIQDFERKHNGTQ